MKIWVDADACPVVIREILFRAAERTGVELTLVANQPLSVPRSRMINTLQVPAGFDVADNEIVRRIGAGDLVITADIPLAPEVIGHGHRVTAAHCYRGRHARSQSVPHTRVPRQASSPCCQPHPRRLPSNARSCAVPGHRAPV